MWSQLADHFDGAHAVSDGGYMVGVKAVLGGPAPPLAVDGLGGIDENTIKVEEHGRADEIRHCKQFLTGWSPASRRRGEVTPPLHLPGGVVDQGGLLKG